MKIVFGGNVVACIISALVGYVIDGYYNPSYIYHISKIVLVWNCYYEIVLFEHL